jgi:hypothetical protein
MHDLRQSAFTQLADDVQVVWHDDRRINEEAAR